MLWVHMFKLNDKKIIASYAEIICLTSPMLKYWNSARGILRYYAFKTVNNKSLCAQAGLRRY